MPKGVPTSPRQFSKYRGLRRQGWSQKEAAGRAGISVATAQRFDADRSRSGPPRLSEGGGRFRTYGDGDAALSGPVPLDQVCDEARRALSDFAYFQRRYFGRIATPWQAEAAEQMVGFLESPDKEHVVVNCPPGAGKSTLFTLDLPAYVTVRNRAIRGQIGSKVESSARKYVQRLRRALERTKPILGEAEAVAKGLALDAESTLAADFGSFKPENREMWAADAFVVAQHGGALIDEKEPTWSAFGMDSGFLGMRYDLIVWDDLVDKLVLRTVESRQNQQEWWDDVAEKRLDPSGLLVLQGQRMGADDLYRYALDKRVLLDDDPDSEPSVEHPRKYHHIVFKAHYDDRCENQHGRDAAYYPQGCLLDPRRLPWRELRSEQSNPRNNFAVIYQQEDTDPDSVLVDPIWVSGGTDPRTGENHPGCRDKDRDCGQLPEGLYGDLLSVATADPSPTKYWSVQWWIVRCSDGQAHERYLMDHERRAMDAPTFLDWSNPTQSFTGLMEEWQRRSVDLGHPITHWIVEANAAQRFMLQYEHMRRWLATWRVDLIPHQTHRNKSDPDYGVQTMGGIYKWGLVRLPWYGRGRGFMASSILVEEVTHWPAWRTDDTVMAQWFLEWHLPHLIPAAGTLPRFKRPSWLKEADTYSWAASWKRGA